MDLNTFWFILVGVLFTGYAILDGFDLGAGLLLLCVKGDRNRRVVLNAIGPIWNGNEVWLVTGGGALFAAFPEVYATVFSGFYDLFMLLLAALIFRAAAIEFRSHRPGAVWRAIWDVAFAGSSLLSALLLGATLGNIVWGIPLNEGHEFQGDVLTLLHPYALLSGATTVFLFAMHANAYLALKTEGDLQAQLIRWMRWSVPTYFVFFVAMAVATLQGCPHIESAVRQRPYVLGLIGAVSVPITFNILIQAWKGNAGYAFLSSCASIALHMLLVGAAIYPVLVFSTPDHGNDLDIYNGASTAKTLNFMFYVAIIGVPIVLSYTISIYYVFRGKVELTDESY